jgi:hypothetical protein
MGSIPSTRIASSSSRIFRAPRSAQMAAPPAPAMISAVTIGPASRTTASTDAAPVNDWAPSWRTSEPSCRAMTAPNGIETSAAGRIDTELMNHACWMNSRTWNGRRPIARNASRLNAKKVPLWRTPRVTRSAMASP